MYTKALLSNLRGSNNFFTEMPRVDSGTRNTIIGHSLCYFYSLEYIIKANPSSSPRGIMSSVRIRTANLRIVHNVPSEYRPHTSSKITLSPVVAIMEVSRD